MSVKEGIEVEQKEPKVSYERPNQEYNLARQKVLRRNSKAKSFGLWLKSSIDLLKKDKKDEIAYFCDSILNKYYDFQNKQEGVENSDDIQEGIIEGLGKIREMVEYFLETDESTRNDDTLLILRCWERVEGIKLLKSPQEISGLINFESIRRIRQKIQNEEHKFIPTDINVARKRRIKEEVFKEYFKKA